ncbi:hypothetical protein [Celerinatantimonas yamalensis]|uniref:Uncharacterized protein n=1 Tax=Celerinatantimonas yamalensis TaxID=559956 RepID=A0ABW9G7I7_9GAMM
MANFWVKRTIRLQQPLTPSQTAKLAHYEGLADYQDQALLLTLHYDARKLNFEGIVHEIQLTLAQSRWNRCKARYYQFTDSNLADAAGASPPCCNKPPRR